MPNLDASRDYDIVTVDNVYFVSVGHLQNPDSTFSSQCQHLDLEEGIYYELDLESL